MKKPEVARKPIQEGDASEKWKLAESPKCKIMRPGNGSGPS
jgi:hypothetical protein